MPDPAASTNADVAADRPGLVIVSNVATPYRIHLHRRVAAEIPELALYSAFTHGRADFNWDLGDVSAIRPIWLAGADEEAARAGDVRQWGRELRRARRLIAHARAHDVRAFLLNGYNDLTRLRLVAWARRHDRAVFVRGDSNIRGDRAAGGPRAWLKRRVVGWVMRRCDAIMPMGRLGQAYFERYGADPARCHWVPYEPDYALFGAATDDDRRAFRARHGLDPARRHLLYSGRLTPVKRVDLLIDAFAGVATERDDWDLVVAGDGALRAALEARVPAVLAGRVHWLGFLEVEAIRTAYQVADLLVLPSDYEPWALVVNEAMAAGCPVIATDVVGAAYELVEDGVNGRLVPPGDLEALTAALRDATEPARLAAMRAAVAPALERWRREADPVAGIRAALVAAGVLEV